MPPCRGGKSLVTSSVRRTDARYRTWGSGTGRGACGPSSAGALSAAQGRSPPGELGSHLGVVLHQIDQPAVLGAGRAGEAETARLAGPDRTHRDRSATRCGHAVGTLRNYG